MVNFDNLRQLYNCPGTGFNILREVAELSRDDSTAYLLIKLLIGDSRFEPVSTWKIVEPEVGSSATSLQFIKFHPKLKSKRKWIFSNKKKISKICFLMSCLTKNLLSSIVKSLKKMYYNKISFLFFNTILYILLISITKRLERKTITPKIQFLSEQVGKVLN